MKIAYLTSACIPSTAANSVQSVRMCEAIAAEGHEVTLFARRGDEPVSDLRARYGIAAPVELVAFRQRGAKGFHTLSFLDDVRRAVRRMRPDALFARDVLSASLLARGLPLVFDIHSLPPPRSIQDRLLRRLVRRPETKGIVTITRALKQLTLDRYPSLRPDDVTVLPNGAADPMHDAAGPPAHLPGEGLRVGYVGHLYRGRGVEQIVEAAGQLPELNFHLIGGRDIDVQQWRSQGPPPNLFFHGYVPHAELGRYYRELDILVAPYASRVFDAQGKDSAAYASPMKVFEYMAAGRPIVATALPGVLEVLNDGDTGLIVPPDDGAAFVAALRRLAGDRDLRRRLGAAARRRYEERHSWQARARAALALYDFPG